MEEYEQLKGNRGMHPVGGGHEEFQALIIHSKDGAHRVTSHEIGIIQPEPSILHHGLGDEASPIKMHGIIPGIDGFRKEQITHREKIKAKDGMDSVQDEKNNS